MQVWITKFELERSSWITCLNSISSIVSFCISILKADICLLVLSWLTTTFKNKTRLNKWQLQSECTDTQGRLTFYLNTCRLKGHHTYSFIIHLIMYNTYKLKQSQIIFTSVKRILSNLRNMTTSSLEMNELKH